MLSNIDESQDINKIVSSANSSIVRINDESLYRDSGDNLNGYPGIMIPNECSFGDFARLGNTLGSGMHQGGLPRDEEAAQNREDSSAAETEGQAPQIYLVHINPGAPDQGPKAETRLGPNSGRNQSQGEQ